MSKSLHNILIEVVDILQTHRETDGCVEHIHILLFLGSEVDEYRGVRMYCQLLAVKQIGSPTYEAQAVEEVVALLLALKVDGEHGAEGFL